MDAEHSAVGYALCVPETVKTVGVLGGAAVDDPIRLAFVPMGVSSFWRIVVVLCRDLLRRLVTTQRLGCYSSSDLV